MIPSPKVTAVSVDGGKNAPTGDPSGPDGEVELDIEVAGAIAPGAEIAAYFAPNTDQGFIDAVTTAVHDANLKPSIISICWGGPESSWTEQSRDAPNTACQDAATMGVTVLAASRLSWLRREAHSSDVAHHSLGPPEVAEFYQRSYNRCS
jgi:kumamolisin